MKKQEIKKVCLADFDDNGETVAVTVCAHNHLETFYIQTTNGRYKTELGCLILTDTDERVDIDDYNMFDFAEIIESAQDFLLDKTA